MRLLVGVDRLDYTKGIPRRLLSYEKMLQTHPELRERVRLVQVAVPSRTGVGAYQDFRALVDGLVGRINGDFGDPALGAGALHLPVPVGARSWWRSTGPPTSCWSLRCATA